MEDKVFTWTPERTLKLFQLRFENDSLFKKKAQPWKEFRNILLQNGFPKEMTVDHVRKKWSYSIDSYRIAKRTKNKKWLYYKVFDKHFGKSKALDQFDSWNDDWRLTLVNSIVGATNVDDNNINWRIVENDLRSQDLPIDCSIQDIKKLWHHLKVTFHRKYRVQLKKGAELTDWPIYQPMYNYYQTFYPNVLSKLDEQGSITEQFKSVLSSKFYYKTKSKYEENLTESNGNEEFHWTRDITESFIQLRLQHEWMFKEKKWAWNDLVSMMKTEYGYPKHLTARYVCHKWSSTYGDYQKAKATKNYNWPYYHLFEAYGQSSFGVDPLKDWSEEWILNFIKSKTEIEEDFIGKKLHCNAWRKLERNLRLQGVPLDHSLLELQEMWLHILKTYRWKRKFANKGILNEKWPYYEAMTLYMDKKQSYTCDNVIRFNKNNNTFITNNDDDMNGDDYEDDIKLFDLKKSIQNKAKIEEMQINTCRTCGVPDAHMNLFESYDGSGVDLANKLHIIAGIEVKEGDGFPSKICVMCLDSIENAFNFRKKCQELDNNFRNIKYINIKIENLDQFNNHQDFGSHIADDGKIEHYDIDEVAFADENHISEMETLDFIKKEKKSMVLKGLKVKRKSKKPAKTRADYTRVCEICGKRTQSLKTHMDAHATENCYKCEECGRKFKYKSGLILHKAKHNPTPKKTCEVCGKTFHVLAHYRKHFVYHREKKLTCETCGKAFHTKEILTVHMRMHTDERPFSCTECGKTFRTSGCVSRHRRIVHKKNKIIDKQ